MSSGGQSGSSLLLDEYFASGDDRFLGQLRATTHSRVLAALADRWKRDPRPWARKQQLAYLELPFDVPGHQPLVKRLFKQAEEQSDDELMAAFMVAFDRLVRRERRTRMQYDWQTRQSWREEILRTPRNRLPQGIATRKARDPRTGKVIEVPVALPQGGLLFSHRTRYYLRRRAWRYFRHLGHRRPADYPLAVARALAAYRDDDVSRGEHVLECWGLMQACFREHPALKFGATNIRPRPERSLTELTPAPRFAVLWQRTEALPVLLWLITAAHSRLVRQWAIDLASREHAAGLTDLDVDSIVGLLHHADAAIQQFGAGLLERSNRLAALSVEDWRKLLTDGHFATLPAICAAMERHLAPDRLSLDECVELANARAAPVARLGLTWLRTRNVRSAADVAVVGRLAGAQCDALAHEVAGWALSIVGSPGNYDARTAASFFDSPLTEVRDAAWEWLIADSPGADDPALFVMLLETPYDDLRLRLIDRLAQRSALPGCGVDDLAPVWSAVLLGVVRGGRRKPKAVVQLAAAIATDPNRADALLPVLAAAVRSIRRPEALAALAAVVTLADGSPRLALEIASHLPELRLPQEEVA